MPLAEDNEMSDGVDARRRKQVRIFFVVAYFSFSAYLFFHSYFSFFHSYSFSYPTDEYWKVTMQFTYVSLIISFPLGLVPIFACFLPPCSISSFNEIALGYIIQVSIGYYQWFHLFPKLLSKIKKIKN